MSLMTAPMTPGIQSSSAPPRHGGWRAARVCLAGVLLALAALGIWRVANLPEARKQAVLQQTRTAAQEGQRGCQERIHHNTLDFESCILNMARAAQGDAPRQLGLTYFGWVAAMNSARMGMLGARITAWRMMTVFVPIQRRLGISDEALCAVVPGPCEVRVAQLRQMAAQPAPTQAEINEARRLADFDEHRR
jgi:hypothetical protein